ncbi:unnamed protein product [Amoebophrya sp. A25]|nr:unnamed protein product [Amoebophrya sp. A25]|eukprot:GSA25T00007825001.1
MIIYGLRSVLDRSVLSVVTPSTLPRLSPHLSCLFHQGPAVAFVYNFTRTTCGFCPNSTWRSTLPPSDPFSHFYHAPTPDSSRFLSIALCNFSFQHPSSCSLVSISRLVKPLRLSICGDSSETCEVACALLQKRNVVIYCHVPVVVNVRSDTIIEDLRVVDTGKKAAPRRGPVVVLENKQKREEVCRLSTDRKDLWNKTNRFRLKLTTRRSTSGTAARTTFDVRSRCTTASANTTPFLDLLYGDSIATANFLLPEDQTRSRRMFNNDFGGFGGEPPAKKIRLSVPAPASSSSGAAKDDPLGPLALGETTTVPGSGSATYVIERKGPTDDPDRQYYICSCPAFKFGPKNKGTSWAARTCKHLEKFRGADKEAFRITNWLTKNGQNADVPGAPSAAAPPSMKKAAAKGKAKAKAGASPAVSKASAAAGGSPSKDTDIAVLLAQTWEPGKIDVAGWWVSEKLDGVRAVWKNGSFYSRAGNPFNAPAWFTQDMPKDRVLDGELFLDRGKFQKCVGVVKKQIPIDAEWQLLRFCVFDIIEDSASKPFEARMAEAQKLLQGKKYAIWHKQERLPRASSMGTSSTPDGSGAVAKTIAAVERLLKGVEAKGGEGLMLREPGSGYEKKRSNTLLKVKSFFDLDCIVTKIEKGTGKYKDCMGALHCKDKNGSTFKVGTGFTDNQRQAPPTVGAIITVKYQEKTNDGKPRFPVFLRVRTDITKLA